MRTLVLLTCALITTGRVSGAEEPVNPDEKGIFDFSELDVPKEEEKKAQETLEKDDRKADATLPEAVRRMLDRLTVFEVVEKDVLGKRIAPLRTALKDKLIALSDKAAGQVKVDLIGLAKYVEGLAVEDVLKPESITLTAESGEGAGVWAANGKYWAECRPDGSIGGGWAGTWRWLNKQRTFLLVEFPEHNHVDLLMLSSPMALEAPGFNNIGHRYRFSRKTAAAGTGRKPAAEGLDAVSGTAEAEMVLRSQANQDIAKRREGVARWLVEQAKAAPPAAAAKVLAEAGNLNPQIKGKPVGDAGRFAGVWLMDNRSKLEFRPDGTVKCSKPGKATWIPAKVHNRGTAYILFGKPDDPTDIWIARVSNFEAGVLRIYTRDKISSARLE